MLASKQLSGIPEVQESKFNENEDDCSCDDPPSSYYQSPSNLLLTSALDDLEAAYLSDEIVKRVESGQEQTYTLDELEKELGLAD